MRDTHPVFRETGRCSGPEDELAPKAEQRTGLVLLLYVGTAVYPFRNFKRLVHEPSAAQCILSWRVSYLLSLGDHYLTVSVTILSPSGESAA